MWNGIVKAMDNMTERVAAEIRAEAGRQGLNSQSALSRATGVPRPSLRKYVYALEQPLPLEVLHQVANALGVSASEMMSRAEQAGDNDAADVESVEDLPKMRFPTVRRVTGSRGPRTHD